MDDRITGDKFRYGYFSSRDGGMSTLIKRDFDAPARDRAKEGLRLRARPVPAWRLCSSRAPRTRPRTTAG